MALSNDSHQSNHVLVASVVNTIGENAINAFPDPAPILGLLETNPDFLKLQDSVEKTWRASISGLATNSLDRASRLVLLHSYLYLPPESYMRCLEQVLDLYQQGRIKHDEMVHIFIVSPRAENRWFLSYNANKPQMAKFLERTRFVFRHDPQMVKMIDFIVEGKARIRDERLRGENPSLSKRMVPNLPDE